MRVLFVSGELIGASLALRLQAEGCEVKLFIEDKTRKDCLDNLINKTSNWKKELKWVGKDGLVVFDDVGYGKDQDALRKKGYNVFGGSEFSDKLEKDRAYGQSVMEKSGIKILPTFNFKTIKTAINFIKKNPDAWVVKQNGHLCSLNYVGVMQDGSDSLGLLESYNQRLKKGISISLQKRVEGVEIGVARYFNGFDWVGPIEINAEHKNLFNDNIGPLTGEMGTVMKYITDENNLLFQSTLAKLVPWLRKANFKGDVDINCIVDEKNIYPLEFTTRLGCPSTQLQIELSLSPWKEFLLAVAKGESYDLKIRNDYGVVVSVSIPPFPYGASVSGLYYSKGAKILFKENLTDGERKSLHLEEVSKNKKGDYVIAGANGFIMYITGHGESVEKARQNTYDLVKKVVVPKMFYRTDIGLKFAKTDAEKLHEWGWL